MLIIALVASIHAASADEASDAVQVLLKLWKANLEASNQGCEPQMLPHQRVQSLRCARQ
jgi:hypothetical protein